MRFAIIFDKILVSTHINDIGLQELINLLSPPLNNKIIKVPPPPPRVGV